MKISQKIFRWLIFYKIGRITLLIVSVIGAFALGYWVSGGSLSESKKPLPLSEEEKKWQEDGLLFDDGIYIVGQDIQPGIYRTTAADKSLYGCRWQRLSGFGAENDNVIVNYVEDKGMPTIVKIASTDKGFKTQGCGKWYADSVSILEDKNDFGDGAFIVGQDIAPGTYKSSAQWGCSWERLSGFSRDFYNGRLLGKDSELIAASSNKIVTISSSDKGFISYKCGQWVKQDI